MNVSDIGREVVARVNKLAADRSPPPPPPPPADTAGAEQAIESAKLSARTRKKATGRASTILSATSQVLGNAGATTSAKQTLLGS